MASALSCEDVGDWVVSECLSPPIISRDEVRFPMHRIYREPPKDYLSSPQPSLQPRYLVTRPQFTTKYKNQIPFVSTTLQSPISKPPAVTTLSTGAIYSEGGGGGGGGVVSKNASKQNQPPTSLHKSNSTMKRKQNQSSLRSSSNKISQNKSTPPPNQPEPLLPFLTDGSDPKTNIQFTVTVSKRSNGNQPWESSNVRPPMLGKMRQMTVQFAPFVLGNFEVLFQCKDLKQGLHEGKLIVSPNDKGVGRNFITSSTVDETIFRAILAPSRTSQSITVFLKPCWRGFGSNHERPVFLVTVALRPADRDCAFVVLHSWKVELHSHKMESSNKGKAMDANGPFDARGSIPLSVLEQPSTAQSSLTTS